MKRTAYVLALLMAAAGNIGCAGMQSAWRLQVDMRYVTPGDAPAKPPLPAGRAS